MCFSDPLADYEDVVPLPIFGPSLTINGHAAQWKDAAEDGSNGLTIRLNFQADSCSKAFNTINITNDGTAAMYFSWKVANFFSVSSACDLILEG